MAANFKTHITSESITVSQMKQLDMLQLDAKMMFESIPQLNTTGSKKEREASLANFREAVNKMWIKNRAAITIIDNIAITAACSPGTSFREFSESLPKLVINGNSPPEDSKLKLTVRFGTFFQLGNIDHRYMFNVYFDQILAIFTNKLLLAMERSRDPLPEILNFICENFDAFINNAEQKFEPLVLSLAELWSKNVSLISKLSSASTRDVMMEQIRGIINNSTKPLKRAVVFTLFSQVTFSENENITNDIIKVVNDVVKSPLQAIYHFPAFEWLSNIAGNALQNDQTLRTSEFLLTISEVAKKYQDNTNVSDPAELTRAQVYVFSTYKSKLKLGIDEYLEKYITKDDKLITTGNAKIQLRAMTTLLRGKNYQPQYLLTLSHKNLGFYDPEYCDKLSSICFASILSHSHCFSDAQEELSECLFQIAVINFKEFVNMRMKKLLESNFINKNDIAVFSLIRKILSPSTGFEEGVSTCTKELFNKFIHMVIECFKGVLENIKQKELKSVWEAETLADTITLTKAWTNISVPDGVNKKLAVCLESLFETSQAIDCNLRKAAGFIPSVKKSITPFISKFIERFVFQNIENSTPTKGDIPPLEITKEIIALATIPFIMTDVFNGILVNLVFGGNYHISAFALRALQALIYQQPNNATEVIRAFCKYVPNSLEALMVQLQAINAIVIICQKCNAPLEEENEQLLFTLILASICSPSTQIRSKALTLASNVANLKSGIAANFDAFVKSYAEKIEKEVQTRTVSIGSYNQVNLSNIDPIRFNTFISSNEDTIYTLFLSILGKELINSPYKPYVERAIPGIATIAKQIGQKSELFIINMYIFISATATEETSSNATSVVADCAAALSSKTPEQLLPYVAYYTSHLPSIGMPVIEGLKIESSFIAHVASVAVRNLLSISEDYSDFVIKKIHEIIQYIVSSKKVSSSPDFSIDQGKLEQDQHIICAICNISYCVKEIYTRLYERNITESHGPYPYASRFSGEMLSGDNFNALFGILVNASCAPEEKFQQLRVSAREALSAFSHVFLIPDEMFTQLQENLDIVAEISFSVLVSILTAAYSVMLNVYIMKSIEKPVFFRAIAAQFMEIKSLDTLHEKWKQNVNGSMSDKETDLASQTKACCGQLIALSFYMITSLDVTLRSDALRTLICVSLATSMIDEPSGVSDLTPIVRKFIKYLDEVILPPEKTESLASSISGLLSNALRPYTEPILKEAFRIMNIKKGNYIYTTIISMWVHDMTFNREEAGLFDGQDPKNVKFTGFSLIKSFILNGVSLPLNSGHYRFIDAFLNQESIGTDTKEFLILSIYSIQQSNPEVTDRLVAILTYIFSRYPNAVVEHISKFYTFKAWFYFQIQLLRMDAQFDIEEIFNNTEGNEREESEADSKVSDLDLYDVTIEFTSKVILNLFKEKRDVVLPALPYIIVFCVVYYDDFNEIPKKLLEDLISATQNKKQDLGMLLSKIESSGKLTIAAIQNKFSKNIKKLSDKNCSPISIDTAISIMQLIYELPQKEIAKLSSEALKWGTTCGELRVAYRAIVLYSLTAVESSTEIVKLILNTLYSFSSVLREVTTPGWKAKKLAGIINDDAKEKFNATRAYSYITALVDVLDETVSALPVPSQDAFRTVIQLFNCQRNDTMPVLESAISFIQGILSNEAFVSQFTTTEEYLPNLLTASHEESSLNAAIKFLCNLPMTKSFKCISNLPPEVAFFAVLPYLYSHRHEEEIVSVISAFKAQLENREVSDMFDDFFNKEDSTHTEKFIHKIAKTIDPAVLISVIAFYRTLISYDKDASIYAYQYLQDVLTMKDCPLKPEKFGAIADMASARTTTIISAYAVEFLKALREQGGDVQKTMTTAAVKQFPAIVLPYNFQQYVPNDDIDPFASITTLPPFSIIDIEYYGCEFNEPFHEILQLIKVAPFTQWSETIFRAESIQIQDNMNFNPDKVELGNNEAFFTKLDASIMKGADDTTSSSPVIITTTSHAQSASSKEMSAKDDGNEDCDIPIEYTSFLPSSAEIKALGADILQGLDLPDYF
jgi:hypothetical protein